MTPIEMNQYAILLDEAVRFTIKALEASHKEMAEHYSIEASSKLVQAAKLYVKSEEMFSS